MSIIAFTNEKGGVGKSTTSVHFAYWLADKKKKVALIDADPQRSCSKWIAEEVDYLVIDAPPGLAECSRAILFRTDLAIIPCQPTGLDLDAASDAVRLVRQAQSVRGGLPHVGMFVNRAAKGTKLKDEALSLIQKIDDVIALKTVIHQKQAVADAFGQGATVFDLKGAGASDAAAEFEKLFKEIMRLI
jgi:chromosome partitioning protein